MATTATQQPGTAVAQQKQTDTKGLTTYNVAGNEVKLSYEIVRNFLVKGNGNVSDQDLVQFISICKFNQLNPFLNEAYLVKFGTQPAQMIVSKEALMKRADACPEYEGIKAGIIVEREDGSVEDFEGCFYGSKEKLVGGWAQVFRKDRKFPIISRVRLDEYDKKQSIWNEKKSTMISKIAKVQALREAFPAQLGAMYTQEERGVQDAQFVEIKEDVATNANKTQIAMDMGDGDGNMKKATADTIVDPETGEIKEQAAQTANAASPGF